MKEGTLMYELKDKINIARFFIERARKSTLSLMTIYLPFFKRRKRALSVELRLTNKCNRKCAYCNSFNIKMEEMSTEEIFKLIDEVGGQCIHLVLTGGEPLLRPDISRIIDYVKDNYGTIFLTLCTNGKTVPKKIDKIKRLDALILSLDGPEEIHDKLRGKGSYKEVMKTMRIVKEKTDVRLWTITVLTKYNIDCIDFIAQKAKEIGFSFYVQPVYDYDLSIPDVDHLRPGIKKLKKELNKLIDKHKKIRKRIVNSTIALKYLTTYPRGDPNMKCMAGHLYCLVDVNGDVYPCWGLKGKVKPLNVREVGFKKAFENANKTECKGCFGSANIELNYAFNSTWQGTKTASKHLLLKVIGEQAERRYGL